MMKRHLPLIFIFAMLPFGCLDRADDESRSEPAPGGTSGVDEKPESENGGASAVLRRDCTVKVPEGCFSAGCEAVSCGTDNSIYDEHMCMRDECESDANCDPGLSCQTRNYVPFSCATGAPDCECGPGLTAYGEGDFCLAE